MGGYDLLSLLIKSNIAADMPENMRMSDSEILSREHIVSSCVFRLRITMICSRGTDISACRARNFEVKTVPVHTNSYLTLCCSTAVVWTLFAFACHPTVQSKLRAELRTCPTDSPTMEQLNSLPYLEGVVREALRLYAPVSATHRIAMHDAEIPLQKPFTDKQGVLRNTIRYE